MAIIGRRFRYHPHIKSSHSAYRRSRFRFPIHLINSIWFPLWVCVMCTDVHVGRICPQIKSQLLKIFWNYSCFCVRICLSADMISDDQIRIVSHWSDKMLSVFHIFLYFIAHDTRYISTATLSVYEGSKCLPCKEWFHQTSQQLNFVIDAHKSRQCQFLDRKYRTKVARQKFSKFSNEDSQSSTAEYSLI